jgi:hypothetical protein
LPKRKRHIKKKKMEGKCQYIGNLVTLKDFIKVNPGEKDIERGEDRRNRKRS